MNERRERSVTCTFCSCCCTDLELVFQGRRISGINPACPVAEKGFTAAAGDPPSPESGGASVSRQNSLEEICRRLRAARLPLIWVGGGISYESQRVAIKLAKKVRACVDTPASQNAFALARALSESGLHLLTLGELRERVDTLVFWGVDLARTHPRFWERFVRNDRTRKIINVNSFLPVQEDETTLNLPVNRQLSLDILIRLRLMNQNQTVDASPILHALAAALQSAQYGCLIFDASLAALGYTALREAFQLIQELNDRGKSRWFGLMLEEGINIGAASNALFVGTGFPAAVRFTENGGAFSSLEWSAETLIQNRETDLFIRIGDITPSLRDVMKATADQNPGGLTYVVIDSKPPEIKPSVWLSVKAFGVSGGGTALRMDGVPIPSHPYIESPEWELTDVLERLAEEVSP